MTWIVFALLAAVTVAMASASGREAWVQKVDGAVLAAAGDGQADFVVDLGARADLSGAASLTSKEAKGRYVYKQLTAVADQTQPAVVAALSEHGAKAQRFWVSNVVVASGNLDALQAVAGRADVDHVYAVGKGRLEPPVPVSPPGGINGSDAVDTVFDSIALVKADQAWGLGYRGQGAVVAGADTGVRWTHNALKSHYRGWNGATANHDYNWHDAIKLARTPRARASSPHRATTTTSWRRPRHAHHGHDGRRRRRRQPDRHGARREVDRLPQHEPRRRRGAARTWTACSGSSRRPKNGGTTPTRRRRPTSSTTRGAASRSARRRCCKDMIDA